MDYPIPASTEEILALGNNSVNEEIIVMAIAGAIGIARKKGQSLEDLTKEVLHDDRLLDLDRRKWLSELITQAWMALPSFKDEA